MEYRRHLPHFHPSWAWIFLTCRLSGTLPKGRTGLKACPDGHAFVRADRALDVSPGPRWLADSRVARAVADQIRAGETERRFYCLRAWVIMPNHVHLLIRPNVPLPQITQWLKGSTAHLANGILARRGAFWQDESFDRWVRNDSELEKTVRYIERNPVVAGLVEAVELWPYSSAS